MSWIGDMVTIAGALSVSIAVMRLIDALEKPRKQKKTPTKGQLRQGQVNRAAH